MKQLCVEEMGERRMIVLSFLPREWCRCSHCCQQRIMLESKIEYDLHHELHTGIYQKTRSLFYGLWSHSLFKQTEAQAAARGDVPVFPPSPLGHHSHTFDHEMSQIRNKFS